MGSSVTTLGNRGALIVGAGAANPGATFGPTATPFTAAWDTGPIGPQVGSGWGKWVCSYIVASGAGTGFTVEWFGCIDENTAYGANAYGNVAYSTSTLNWISLTSPSTEAGRQFVNPQTAPNQVMYAQFPLVAVRALITTSAPSGSILLLVYATQ